MAAQVASGDGDPRHGTCSTGRVEVDETFVGGDETGLHGGRRARQESPGRDRRRVSRRRIGSDPPGAHPRRRPPLAPRVHHQPRRTRVDDPAADGWPPYEHHRHGSATGTRPTSIRASTETASDLLPSGPPRRRAAQTLARRHPPRSGPARAARLLPRRVHLPLQPARLARSRTAVLPPPAPGGPHRPHPFAAIVGRQADPPRHADHHPQASTQDVVGTVTKRIALTHIIRDSLLSGTAPRRDGAGEARSRRGARPG